MEASLIISILLIAAALAACVISVAMNNWYVAEGQLYVFGKHVSQNVRYGLWKRCSTSDYSAFNFCDTWSDYIEKRPSSDYAWIQATQAVMILSLVTVALSLTCITLYGFVIKDRGILFYIAVTLAFVGGIASVVGLSVFGALHEEFLNERGLHAGFGLATLSACLSFISTFFMFVLWRTRAHEV